MIARPAFGYTRYYLETKREKKEGRERKKEGREREREGRTKRGREQQKGKEREGSLGSPVVLPKCWDHSYAIRATFHLYYF